MHFHTNNYLKKINKILLYYLSIRCLLGNYVKYEK